ncbi:OprD family outer membrane porin [Hydrogenimonas sp.]
MKKGILSLAAIAALTTGALQAKESLADAITQGKFKGQLRMFYIDRDYDGFVTTHRASFAAGGHFGYETGAWNGLSAGAVFYTTNTFGIGNDNLPGEGYDPTLTKRDGSGYTILGEAYLKYVVGNSTFKFGRQRLDTPMAGSDDARMLPNLFEAYLFTNTDLPDTTLIAAHVMKMAQGTFGNVYKGGGLGATAGYTLVAPNDYRNKMGVDDPTGEFVDMGTYAIGKETDGVTVGAAIYKGIPGLKLQAWDYYAWDILNIVYLQGDYGWNCRLNDEVKMLLSAQYIHENDVGDSYAGDIDSDYYGLRLKAAWHALSGYIAYSSTEEGDDNNQLGSSIITVWGGMPAFTQGMVTRHQFFADTDTWKAAGTYKFNDLGVNANATLYYASFDVGENNPYNNGKSWTATESGFDIKYYPESAKNLQLRFRANFPRDFYDKHATKTPDHVDWDEYRFIVNYTF